MTECRPSGVCANARDKPGDGKEEGAHVSLLRYCFGSSYEEETTVSEGQHWLRLRWDWQFELTGS